MTIFDEEESDGNLVYDNVAFLHYLTAVFSILAVVLLGFIVKDTGRLMKPKYIKEAEKEKAFKKKAEYLWRFMRSKDQNQNSRVVWKIIAIGICLAVVSICINSTSNSNELASFDPYQILNVNVGATNIEIKKGYRKLALEEHPDRKKGSPESGSNRFILISKAYKCLTDQKTRENCLKYGNPDGQIYHKIGIGLPAFLLQKQYSNYIGYGLLVVVLIVIPTLALKWISSIERKRPSMQNSMKNNPLINKLMTPRFNSIDGCLILACSPQISPFIPFESQLRAQEESETREILMKGNLSQHQLTQLNPQTLYRFRQIHRFMQNSGNQSNFAIQLPSLCREIIKYSLYFAKKELQGKLLNNKYEVQWFGLVPCRLAIQFYRRMINRSQSLEIEGVSPQFQLKAKLKIEEFEVDEATVDDIVRVDVKIQKKNQTLGYVCNSNYPSLLQQEFVLLVSSNSNLISSLFFNFAQSRTISHSLDLKKLPVGHFKLNIQVYCLNYFNCGANQMKSLQVFQRFQKRQIIVHEEDKRVEKIPKNFFQSLIDFKLGNDSDLELSDSQSEIEPKRIKAKPKKVKKGPKMSQTLPNTSQQS